MKKKPTKAVQPSGPVLKKLPSKNTKVAKKAAKAVVIKASGDKFDAPTELSKMRTVIDYYTGVIDKLATTGVDTSNLSVNVSQLQSSTTQLSKALTALNK